MIHDDDEDECSENPTFSGTTLEEALAFIQANINKGTKCPVCSQFVKVYRRSITSTMAVALCLIYQHFKKYPNHVWLHIPQFLVQVKRDSTIAGGDVSKLRYWGVLERAVGERDDGSNRLGRYRITDVGRQFVEGKIAVARYAWVFNQTLLRLSEEMVTISDALGNRFNYDTLMKESLV